MTSGNPAKILVVDDERSLERLVKQWFRKQIKDKEFEFIFVRNGREALSILHQSSTVDLILTDIRMPEMDGLTLLEKIPALDPTVKAIVISAYDELKNIRTAMNRGAFDFLTKPIDFQDLEITIRKTLTFVRGIRESQHQLQFAQEQLRYQAFYDSLTGLLNRNGLLRELSECLRGDRQGSSNRFAVLLLDLDRYQTVKFTLGHRVGEQLLKEAARRLTNCVLADATIARMGTDEFAILLKNFSDLQQVKNIAFSIHRTLERAFILEEVAVSSTVSIGIVDNSLPFEGAENVLQAADTAMHYAQMKGKGETAIFHGGMQAGAISRLQLEADLQRAIVHQQLHLNYQPIFLLANERIIGFEALVRWRHPVRGLVSPTDFIPVAEETGLIVPLGEWVLAEAIRRMKRWLVQFPHIRPFSVSVNLSGIQLSNPNLISQIDFLLHEFSLNSNFLKLEITESMFMENATTTSQILEALKDRNIQLCIDDFGKGYSSLSYLHHLPIDILKIDREFINGMVADSKNFDIVRTIINLAHSLGLEVVAEGIETLEQLVLLRELGCECGQGYLFSRPLEAEAVSEFLMQQQS